MATTTLVDPAAHSGFFAGSTYNPRRHSSGMSHSAIGSSTYSPSPLAYSSPSSHGAHSHAASASPSLSTGSLHSATHAKLHKKSHRKAFSSSHLHDSTLSLPSTRAAIVRSDTPPISENHAASFANTFPRSSGSRSFKMGRNMRKHSHAMSDGLAGIDLSRTAEENAERSGIAVTHSQARSYRSPRISDVQFNRTRGHGRSASATSGKVALSSSFTPSMPFVHPVQQQQHDAVPSDLSGETTAAGLSSPVTGLGIEGASSELRRSMSSSREAPLTSTNPGSYKVRAQRPQYAGDNDRVAGSAIVSEFEGSSPPAPSRTFSYSSFASPSQNSLVKTSRSRRGTAVSQKSTDNMHSSRTSFTLERATSFMRSSGGSKDPAQLDMEDAEQRARREAEREAHIRAARRAFTEREEAKDRKYEEQERKAAERRDRKRVKAEERQRRKSEQAESQRPIFHQRSFSGDSRPSTRRRAATLPNDAGHQGSVGTRSSGERHSSIEEEREDEFESALATPAEMQNPWAGPSYAARASVDDSTASDMHADDNHASADTKTSKKRQAKSGYYGFMTWVKNVWYKCQYWYYYFMMWFNTRMLRMHDHDE